MSRPPATHGVVTLAALDLRRTPDHRAELRSQLLLGETVRLLGSASGGRWWRVENAADGYRGWARSWGVVPASGSRVKRWVRRARARVGRTHAEIRERPGAGAVVSPMFWNGRLIAGPARAGWRRVELPDGRCGFAPAAAFASHGARPGLPDRLRGLLGIPYLWGGRTPLGFDCSGFVQQILAERGFRLPRDADEQYRATRRVTRRQGLRAGDLVFFGARSGPRGHVGLLLGGGYYAHVRGWVRINSLDETNPLCDNDLLDTVRGFGRPVRG